MPTFYLGTGLRAYHRVREWLYALSTLGLTAYAILGFSDIGVPEISPPLLIGIGCVLMIVGFLTAWESYPDGG